MTTPHDQYYDEDRRRWPQYADTDPDYNPSIQELAWGPGRDDPDYRDYAEEAYNKWLMDGGDI